MGTACLCSTVSGASAGSLEVWGLGPSEGLCTHVSGGWCWLAAEGPQFFCPGPLGELSPWADLGFLTVWWLGAQNELLRKREAGGNWILLMTWPRESHGIISPLSNFTIVHSSLILIKVCLVYLLCSFTFNIFAPYFSRVSCKNT